MDANTIYDRSGAIVGVFNRGAAWQKKPQRILGYFDFGDVGSIYGSERQPVATFQNGEVIDAAGQCFGRFYNVPWSEMTGKSHPTLAEASVTRLERDQKHVGWCIGRSGAAAAAIALLFAAK